MKKTLLLAFIYGITGLLCAQNSMLQSPVTGQPFTTGVINNMVLASNGTDVVLVIANNATGKLYAIDIQDNNPADSALNCITQPVPAFKTSVEAALGISGGNIGNFEVNPISKSIYILYFQGSTAYLAVAKNNGNTVTAFPLNNVTYSEITYNPSSPTTTKPILDLAYGGNALYLSAYVGTTLAGEVGKVTIPFIHGGSTTNRTTTMFKSNWGGNYFTDAPLERMDYCVVDGVERLCGVTVCAPGFSMKTDDIVSGGLLTVTEDFNIVYNGALKVVAIQEKDTNYLVDLHYTGANGIFKAYRIGHKYLDGSQVLANNYNNQAPKLRDQLGNPMVGLSEKKIKLYPSSYSMIAFYSNCDLLVIDAPSGQLKLLPTGLSCIAETSTVSTVGIEENELKQSDFNIFPNPATTNFTIKTKNKLHGPSELIIKNIEGKEVMKLNLTSQEQSIDISGLNKGTYLLSVISSGRIIYNSTLIK